jgi:FkbM family methyltransferase
VASLHYYGQFDPPVDRFIHERYFDSSPRGLTLMECGAFDGLFESSGKFFEESLGWNCVNIEPSPRIFANLCRNRPLSQNIQAALTDREGSIGFTEVEYPGFELCTNGSVGHLPEHRRSLDAAGCSYRQFTVPGVTFRALLARLGLWRLDLMILDVEGHELSALRGFQGAALLPGVLCVEHGHLGLEVVRDVVEPLGYVLDAVSHVNGFYVRAAEI